MFSKVRNYSLSSLPGLLKFYSKNMKIKYIVVAYSINFCLFVKIFFPHIFPFCITIVDVSCLQVNASLYINTNNHEIPIPYIKDFC